MNFPCSTADYLSRAATSCCLNDFVDLYHVVTTFVTSSNGICSAPYSNPPPFIASDAVAGGFGSDMPASSVILLPTPNPGVQLARLTVSDADLRRAASKFSGQALVSETLETFVGLAIFTAVPGSRILDSTATQARVRRQRTIF